MCGSRIVAPPGATKLPVALRLPALCFLLHCVSRRHVFYKTYFNPYLQDVSSLIQYNNLYFLTCTIHKWNPLLKTHENKKVILDAFTYVVKEQQAIIYGFVILENHFHLLVEVIHPMTISKFKFSLLGHTSTELLKSMEGSRKEQFKISRSNKKHQIWKPNSLAVEIQSDKFLKQKLHYIHKNIARANMNPDIYLYSSWPSYRDGESKFDFLTLWG